jgi:hypothetical protein
MTQDKLEKLLRRARQEVFDKPSRGKAIIWLKRQLEPYWNARAEQLKHEHAQRLLRLYD